MTIHSDRLKEAMTYRGISQANLAKILNLPSSMINQYCQGRNKPKYENLKQIAKVLEVSLDWLMGEDVPMLPDEQETKLMTNFRKLNDIGKEKASEYVEDLTENEKYTQRIEPIPKRA